MYHDTCPMLAEINASEIERQSKDVANQAGCNSAHLLAGAAGWVSVDALVVVRSRLGALLVVMACSMRAAGLGLLALAVRFLPDLRIVTAGVGRDMLFDVSWLYTTWGATI